MTYRRIFIRKIVIYHLQYLHHLYAGFWYWLMLVLVLFMLRILIYIKIESFTFVKRTKILPLDSIQVNHWWYISVDFEEKISWNFGTLFYFIQKWTLSNNIFIQITFSQMHGFIKCQIKSLSLPPIEYPVLVQKYLIYAATHLLRNCFVSLYGFTIVALGILPSA